MSDDNHGSYWEIDHIVPAFLVDLTDPEIFKKWTHYSNLRPLTIEANRQRNQLPTLFAELKELGLLLPDGTLIFPVDKLKQKEIQDAKETTVK